MCKQAKMNFKLVVLASFLMASFIPSCAHAQSIWDKIKQQAQKAQQQVPQQNPQQQQQQQSPQGQQQPRQQQPQQPSTQQQVSSQPASSPSQPASAASQPSSLAADTGNAAPWSPDSGSTVGSTATAGSAANFASSGPPDFSKLPDIGGSLRLGISDEEAQAAMLKMNPGYKVVPGPTGTLQSTSPPGAKYVQGRLGQFPGGDRQHASDTFWAYYAMPPAKQQAFAVSRKYEYPQPGIDRVKLVAALRQKYGPETKAIKINGTGDINIIEMYWVYDEQGNFIASDKGASDPSRPPFNCLPWGISDGRSGSNLWGDMMKQYLVNALPPANFCDSIVLLSVNLGGYSVSTAAFSQATATEIDDHPLLRRDVLIAGEAAKADAQKQQQQQLEKSKQAKPSL
jgi:hypothetical protein